jgi:hypothetical protein
MRGKGVIWAALALLVLVVGRRLFRQPSAPPARIEGHPPLSMSPLFDEAVEPVILHPTESWVGDSLSPVPTGRGESLETEPPPSERLDPTTPRIPIPLE